MLLARGDGQGRTVNGAEKPSDDAQTPVVIAIALSAADRLRLAELVSGRAPLLIVSSAQEAVDLLSPDPTSRLAGRRVDRGRERGVVDGRPALVGIDLDSDRRTASWADQSVGLSPLEHDVLVCLLREPGRTWTFDRLHRDVWGTTYLGAGGDVHSVVKRVRRKLRELGSPLEIETVRGVGLRLVARVPTRCADPAAASADPSESHPEAAHG